MLVEKQETVEVPVGRLTCFVLLWSEPSGQGKWERRWWYCPSLEYAAKYTAQFEVVGAGGKPLSSQPNSWELMGVRVPSPEPRQAQPLRMKRRSRAAVAAFGEDRREQREDMQHVRPHREAHVDAGGCSFWAMRVASSSSVSAVPTWIRIGGRPSARHAGAPRGASSHPCR